MIHRTFLRNAIVGRRPGTRTGGIYIAVMAAVLVVTLIGMSAVLSARVERRASAASDDAVRARYHARSFAEIAMQRLEQSATWRTTYANNTWSAEEAVDGAKLQFRLVDEADNDLTDDSSESFRLQTRATYGSATRSISLLIQPPTSGSGGTAPNKIENGGMEVYTSSTLPPTRWYHYPTGPAETSGTLPRLGSRCCRIYSRPSAGSGLSQDIPVTALRKGATYDLRAFAKYGLLANVRAGIVVTDSTGTTTKFMITRTALLNTWTEISGSVTPTWSGTLVSARFSVESASGTSELRVDECSLYEQRTTTTLGVVSGSIRRDTMD